MVNKEVIRDCWTGTNKGHATSIGVSYRKTDSCWSLVCFLKMVKYKYRIILLLFLGISFLLTIPSCSVNQSQQLPDVVDFNFHIKPILSDRCFVCHGPDANRREAGLRLDIPEIALGKQLEMGGRAFVPGNRKKSMAFQRLISTHDELMMPPQESNLHVSEYEIALIGKWIDQGVAYEPHWSFVKPEKPRVPVNGEGWAENEIDHFIARKLDHQGIVPAPEADREHLIRRVFFDLIGLPPSLEDLDLWMNHSDGNYYDRLVDSLLALPAYGERMAAHWLDVSRFADSEGYLDDFHHTFWPYRDWVIKAYNENLSYDQFILWQIGGDQLENATTEQKLATAFNRHHKQNSEGGIIPEEFRVEYVADRTNTVGSAFLALTVGCARCHDHKHDAFSQSNYYELFAFFNSTVERGDGIFSLNSIENGQKVPNRYSMNAGPVLAIPSEEVSAIYEFLQKEIGRQTMAIHQKTQSNTKALIAWMEDQVDAAALIEAVKQSTVSHLTFDDMQDGSTSDLTPGAASAKYYGGIDSGTGVRGKAICSVAAGQLVADGKRSTFERNEPFTISFWIKAPKVFDEAHVIYNGNDRIQGYRGWDVMLDSNRIHFRLNHAHPYQSIDIYCKDPLPIEEWQHFVWTYDGSGDASGMALYRNGAKIAKQINRNYLYRSTRPYFYAEATVYKPYKGLIIGNRHYDQDFTGGMLDEVRILNKEADPMVVTYLFDQLEGVVEFEAALRDEYSHLDAFYDLFIDREIESMRANLREIQYREIETIDTVQEIMVMGDLTEPRPTYVLERGVYDARGKKVIPNVPSSILPWPETLPRNRYGLGQWLIHSENPLTTRVAVNQIWYLVFGRGIVETVEDFGNQGALPSHPELLDWLATDFMDHHWDLKRLIKQMVTTATYKQSSVIRPELNEIDPDNHLLARGTRYRRTAEMIRDNILASGKLLNQTIGGPSVFPYQPPGLWKEVMTHSFFPEYEVDYDNGLYRRSIYTFWKRNMPPPGMLIFDATSRAECQVRRQRSNTPLQALVLLNDPQMLEGCRAIAEITWYKTAGDLEAAVDMTFRLLTSRHPTPKEKLILHQQMRDELHYFQSHPERIRNFLTIGHKEIDNELPGDEVAALTRVTNTVLNTTEAYYKN